MIPSFSLLAGHSHQEMIPCIAIIIRLERIQLARSHLLVVYMEVVALLCFALLCFALHNLPNLINI